LCCGMGIGCSGVYSAAFIARVATGKRVRVD
jgi:hypothetical protein